MANPRFNPAGDTIISPARIAFAITANDSTDLPFETKSLYVGTGGDLVVTMSNGADVTFKNVAGGSFIDIVAARVKTASTASDIVGLA